MKMGWLFTGLSPLVNLFSLFLPFLFGCNILSFFVFALFGSAAVLDLLHDKCHSLDFSFSLLYVPFSLFLIFVTHFAKRDCNALGWRHGELVCDEGGVLSFSCAF